MRQLSLLFVLLLLGAGCQSVMSDEPPVSSSSMQDGSLDSDTEPSVMFPVIGFEERRTVKNFGEYIQDRFVGYHLGEDIEFQDVVEEVPVFAIADGRVARVDQIGGYGGVVLIEHDIDGETVTALYGHIDLQSVVFTQNDSVEMGQRIAFLGDHESVETDRERKHLHFAIYPGKASSIGGYAADERDLSAWINPSTFFAQQGLRAASGSSMFDPAVDLGGDRYRLSFTVPVGWEVEYVPSIQSLNLFTLEGEGTARDRSQIFIRYFDASDFLTLSTVRIYETNDLTAGSEHYVARRYEIEKEDGVVDFPDQPDWRNDRHVVTDFRRADGFTRYYVVAANPDLDQEVYAAFLASVTIQE